MKPLRAVVVDDEPLAREGLAEMLARIPAVDVVGAFGDAPAALAALDTLRADVLFVDIQMPGMSGLELVEAIDLAPMPAVVFVTAHDAYAIRAFEVNAIDYLLKPVAMERLTQAVERVRAQRSGAAYTDAPGAHVRGAGAEDAAAEGAAAEAAITEHASARGASAGDALASDAAYRDRLARMLETLLPGRPAGASRLIVREVGQIVVVATRDVDWIEGADYYSKLHVGPKVHMLRETLTSLERRLDPRRFFRIHRSVIVNLARVRAVESHLRGDGIVVLATGARLKVTQARREELERRLESLPDAT